MSYLVLEKEILKLLAKELKTGEEIYLDEEQIQQIKDALAWSKNK